MWLYKTKLTTILWTEVGICCLKSIENQVCEKSFICWIILNWICFYLIHTTMNTDATHRKTNIFICSSIFLIQNFTFLLVKINLLFSSYIYYVLTRLLTICHDRTSLQLVCSIAERCRTEEKTVVFFSKEQQIQSNNNAWKWKLDAFNTIIRIIDRFICEKWKKCNYWDLFIAQAYYIAMAIK